MPTRSQILPARNTSPSLNIFNSERFALPPHARQFAFLAEFSSSSCSHKIKRIPSAQLLVEHEQHHDHYLSVHSRTHVVHSRQQPLYRDTILQIRKSFSQCIQKLLMFHISKLCSFGNVHLPQTFTITCSYNLQTGILNITSQH